MSDAEHGIRALQVSGIASAACGFLGYFAAKQLDKPFVDDETRQRGALIFTGLAVLVVLVAAIYAAFLVYRASPRTKMIALLALVVSFGGSYGGWTLGWKKAGDPSAVRAF